MAKAKTETLKSVSAIAASLGMDAKRARRILRKRDDINHEHGGSWNNLDAKTAKQITGILTEANAA